MKVLLTGAFGRVGTAIIEHLAARDEYEFTLLDRRGPPSDGPDVEARTVIADVSDYDAIRPVFENQDAVIHLAGYPLTDGSWEEVLENNIIGMYNVLQATREAHVPSFVFSSSNHVVGMYELEHEPEIYQPEFGLVVDHESPRRPDSFYGVSKAFGEDLGHYFVENYASPEQFYAIRIGSVRSEPYDHPYGDAERCVDQEDCERDSEEYQNLVARMKSLWQSRRDLAHQVDCCLRNESVDFDVFYGVSDNDRRWFDLEHARSVLGYHPRDNGENWNEPPER